MRVIPRRFQRRSGSARTGTMTVLEHLQELRHRLIVAIIALALGSVVGWFLFPPFMNTIRGPFCDYLATHPEVSPLTGCRLVFQSPVEAMLVKLKVVVFLGLAVSLPVVLFQLWAFIVPGLTDRERRWSIPFIASATLLFLLGGAFSYWTLPKAFSFLLGFAGEGAAPLLTLDRYVGFVVLVTLAFGLSFLFPILLVFLEIVGVLSPQRLSSWRRWAILAIAIFAAVITPSGDPYTMLAMMIPMYLFYEASIIIGRLIKR
jgi:sec-independent protein translocase protein TatC